MEERTSDKTVFLDQLGEAIPAEYRRALAPAARYIHEWQPYYVCCPDAERLLCGSVEAERIQAGLFRLRLENVLGVVALQPCDAALRPLSRPVYCEALSPKLPTLAEHLAFYGTLLEDLFARAARLPFTFSGVSQRQVLEALRPPTPLFALHYICHYAADLTRALGMIRAAHHRELRDRQDWVPLAQASDIDADTVLSIVQNPDEWQPAQGFSLAMALRGRAPERVWQRLPEETTDTPENRFVRAFVCQVLAAAEELPTQRWWPNVPDERRLIVKGTTGVLRQALLSSPLDEVGPLHRLPFSSQVLLRHEGYRQILHLWRLFQQARRPLFAPLQETMDVRDIATLYEFWAFFALVEEIAQVLGEEPAIDLYTSDERGLDWCSRVRFGRVGTLVYNRGFGPPTSYSLPLRPDLTWLVNDRPVVALDAKFRLERTDLERADVQQDAPQAVAQSNDLYKMHAYRDALRLRAAVAIYPGDVDVFYATKSGKCSKVSLQELLLGEIEGIGALARKPDGPAADAKPTADDASPRRGLE